MPMVKNKALSLAMGLMFAFGGVQSIAHAAIGITPEMSQMKAVNPNELIMVSDFELNRFIFQAPLKRVYFPADTREEETGPLLNKPLYMSGNTQVALQFHKGETKPIQMIAELKDGRVFSLRLAPRPMPAESHYVSDGKEDKNVKRQQTGGGDDDQPTPRQEDIETMKALASFGEPSQNFSPAPLPVTTRFDKFTVVPISGWSDGDKQAFVFTIVAAPGETAVIAAPQFYRQGITAVMVDGDVVDEKNSPTLYVIEELKNE